MTPAAAKRVALLGILAAGGIAAVQTIRDGKRPTLRLGVGTFAGAMALTALAGPAPDVAAGLGVLTVFGSLAYNTGALPALDRAIGTESAAVVRRPSANLTADRNTGGAPSIVVDNPATSQGGAGTCVDATNLVSIGQGGHRLTASAADGFKRAESLYGSKIVVTDSYRSCAHQHKRYLEEPGRFAPASKSAHPMGLAVDVNLNVMGASNSKLFAALRSAGWCQSRPSDEPWHWSYNGCR